MKLKGEQQDSSRKETNPKKVVPLHLQPLKINPSFQK
jgi:hypothetical protein